MCVDQAGVLGLHLPDPELRWNAERRHHDFGAIDWSELTRVIRGDGPVQRAAHGPSGAAHEDGRWVREAANAYAAKHSETSRGGAA